MTPPRRPGERALDYGILALLLLLYAINLYFLTRLDHAPPRWDEAVHLRDSLVFFNILGDPLQLNLKVIRDIINLSYDYPLLRPSGYYPPLAAAITSLLYFPFGTSAAVGVMSNVLFLLVLVYSVYKLGCTILSREAGLLASIILLLSPIVLEHSVQYMLDLPLTAAVALALYVLIRTEDFANTRYSVLSGICFGLGMLTKWTFLFFVIGPLIYLAIRGILDQTRKGIAFRDRASLRRAALNMALFGIAALVVFGPYYLPILPKLLEETLRYSSNVLAHGPKTLFSVASLVFYPGALWKAMITPYGCLVLIVGMAGLWYSGIDHKRYLWVMLVVPYLVFTFVIQNKLPRYMLPWLVPVSLIIASGILDIRALTGRTRAFRVGRFAVPLLLAPLVLAFFANNASMRDLLVERSRADWNVEKLVSLVGKDLADRRASGGAGNSPAFMGVIPDHFFINAQTIRYYAALQGLPLNVIKLQTYDGNALREYRDTFDRYRYIVTKDRHNIVISSFQESTDEMQHYFHSRSNRFERLAGFEEPDGSLVSVYRKIAGR